VYHRAAVWCSKDLPSGVSLLADHTARGDIVMSILFVTDEGKLFISANKKITLQVENNSFNVCIL
jgi:hypothetical protein